MSDLHRVPTSNKGRMIGLMSLTRSRLVSRLPYVRQIRDKYASRMEEIVRLREALPLLTNLVWESWYPSLAAARQEIAAVANLTGFSDLYRTEEILYWIYLPEWISEWATVASPTKMLDIGAGYGTLALFAAKLTGSSVACLDIVTRHMDESLMESNGVTVREGNVETEDLDWAGPVDCVIMTEVLEHFNFHPIPTMTKIANVLVPGGRLFLSTPDAGSWGRVDGSPASYHDLMAPDAGAPTEDRHIYQFSEDEVREVLTESGFRVLRFERAPGRWGLHHNVEAVKED